MRIIEEELWRAVQERLASVRASYLRGTDGRLWGRPINGKESKYLLTGLTECAWCKNSLSITSRSHGAQRACFYCCTSNRLRGKTVCANTIWLPMEVLDQRILEAICEDLLQPEVAVESVRKAFSQLCPSEASLTAKRRALDAELAVAEAEIANLTVAVAKGGQLDSLLTALHEREQNRERLRAERASRQQAAQLTQLDGAVLRRTLLARSQDWEHLRAQLAGHATIARQLLRKLLLGRIRLTPKKVGNGWACEYTGQATLGRVLAGFLSAKGMVSPTGFEPVLPA